MVTQPQFQVGQEVILARPFGPGMYHGISLQHYHLTYVVIHYYYEDYSHYSESPHCYSIKGHGHTWSVREHMLDAAQGPW